MLDVQLNLTLPKRWMPPPASFGAVVTKRPHWTISLSKWTSARAVFIKPFWANQNYSDGVWKVIEMPVPIIYGRCLIRLNPAKHFWKPFLGVLPNASTIQWGALAVFW